MKLILTLLFALQSTAALALAVEIMGPGFSTCGTWSKSQDHQLFMSWTNGYLSGLSVARQRNVLKSVDFAAIEAWMNNYCQANPLDKVIDAATALFDELNSRSK